MDTYKIIYFLSHLTIGIEASIGSVAGNRWRCKQSTLVREHYLKSHILHIFGLEQ